MLFSYAAKRKVISDIYTNKTTLYYKGYLEKPIQNLQFAIYK